MSDFAGVFTALVTPFIDGRIDFASLSKLVRHQLDNGVQGFVVIGTTAESPCLTLDEKKTLVDAVRSQVARQVPVVVGTGTNSTSETVALTRQAEAWGADGALVVVPYYNKPPQRGLIAHYREVAQATALPVLLYNVPSRTVTGLEIETIVELSQEKNIVGIKEATGDVQFGRQIKDRCRRDFLLTSGDDATFLPLIYSGARGVISVASHVLPKELTRWTEKATSGDKGVMSEFARVEELVAALFVESNPIPVKAALKMMGVIASDEMRLPLAPLADIHRPKLKSLLEKAGALT